MIKNHVRSFLAESLNSFDAQLITNFGSLLPEQELLISNSPGGWSIDQNLSRLVINLVLQREPSQVVEFGAGYSTLILSYVLEKIGRPYQLLSIEQNQDWFKIPPNLGHLFPNKSFPLTLAPVRFKFGFLGIYTRYEIPNVDLIPSQIELQLVDGPQYYYGREGCLDFTYSKLKQGAWVILDDTERYTEQCLIYKWLKVYKGLELIYYNEQFGEKGLAILEVKSPLVKRFSLPAFLLGFMQGTKRFWNMKFGKGSAKQYTDG